MAPRRRRRTIISFIGKAIGMLTGAQDQADAASSAAQTQATSAQAGINEQRRQYDVMQAMMQPFVAAGTQGLSGQQDLLGLHGDGAYQTAINGIQNGAQFKSMQQQGENSILANASATGGLRGGNTQGALAQFSPALLSQLIDSQYSKLGGLTSLGQNSAAGVGNAGMSTGNNIANLLQQQGAATAGGQLAQGGVAASGFNTGMQALGMYKGLGGKF
jgi:hypothetical protein